MWIYLDETANDDWRGAGALALPQPLQAAAVHRALRELEKDPDRNDDRCRAWDARTLRRGYFHACDDSKNSHSHWLNEINRSIQGGAFCFSLAKRDDADDGAAFAQQMALALLTGLRGGHPVTCIFERRKGFGLFSAGRIIEDLYAGLDWSAHEIPHFATHYPLVSWAIAGKDDPGIQAVDFLLWASLQKVLHPESKKACWFDRVKGWSKSYTEEKDTNPFKFGKINARVPVKHETSGMYPSSAIDSPAPQENLLEVYCLVEVSVHAFSRQQAPAHTAHLRPLARQVSLAICSHPTPDLVGKVARVFLRLFDTLPLYGSPARLDQPDFQPWYDAKCIAAILARDHISGNGSLSEEILKRRSVRLRQEPGHPLTLSVRSTSA